MPRSDKQAKDLEAVLDAIKAMQEKDRKVGEKLHKIITENAPDLLPRTWYGMPAYSNGNKIICFFRGREKFGERYITLGFNDASNLDDGNLWPIVYAIMDLTTKEATEIATLVKKAVKQS